MGKEIPVDSVEMRIDNNGIPYIRIKIKTEIINKHEELRDTDKEVNVDIIAVQEVAKMLLQAIYGVISKNLMGYISKKNSGTWDWKRGAQDVGYGIAAVLTVWGAKNLFNVDLTPDAVSGTFVYLSLVWGWDKVIGTINKKFTDKSFRLFS